MSYSVLVVEGVEHIRRVLATTLRREGLDVTEAATEGRGLRLLDERPHDVVLLDLKVPDRDGFQMCRAIRRRTDTPIIVIALRTTSRDVVVGLDAGADDYVVAPFTTEELSARIRGLGRRTRGLPGPRIQVGELDIAPRDGMVTRSGEPVALTRTEFKLLSELAIERGRAVSREELIERVWGADHVGDSRLVDVHVWRLRKKIEPTPSRPTVVTTVRGMGYRLPG
ncbi:response regulator transcription factor [Modestobacter sp. VKM Ac-2984]|uniref:response regulator transcription factor n=1 Tax=Modestobacter sp. VKM Ac-2984 TaxID=3004138 RepID=UPI0022AB0235|nr:response regulator transcription factor [Modestobacter sp. VKM Ac-2984]MCZ2815055.1 response regulator transcription factor [Modestobacter sp. VKM Ac-2984]